MITSKDNEIIKQAAKIINSSKYRKQTGLFSAEGARLCRDAALSGAEIAVFLYTENAKEKYSDDFSVISSHAKRTEEISSSLFDKLTDTKSPQGFMCIIKMKENENFIPDKKGKYAAFENIQDPSNLGTILRTAEALGTDGVILSGDCCDIYSPKVVRGSMGAVFRIKFIICENFTEYINSLTENGFSTYASTPRNAESINKIDFSGGAVVLIGNEGSGLKEETIKSCRKRIKIDMLGRAESLNASAAASILMYELMKK